MSGDGRVRVGTVEELKAKGCAVVSGGPGAPCPIAVFCSGGGEVHAVDNRCPHLGFPLHRGTVEDGILTCHWHHARFDLASGSTLDLWADDVPTYPVRVEDGVVYVSTARADADRAGARDAALARLREGLEQAIGLVVAKQVLALDAAGETPAALVREGALFGATRRDAGFGMGLTILGALARLAPRLDREDRFLALYHGLREVARDCAGSPPRDPRRPLGRPQPLATLERWLRRSVDVRDRDGAERCLATALAAGAPAGAVAGMLLAAATDHVHVAGGHIVDFTNKAFELVEGAGTDGADRERLASAVLPALVRPLVEATRSEELSSWRQPEDLIALRERAAETLPALLERGRTARAAGGPAWADRLALRSVLLGESPGAIVGALSVALADGATAVDLAREVAVAAAFRVARFGLANEHADWLSVLHTFSYANALHGLLGRLPADAGPEGVRGLFDGALSVYLDRFLNVPPAALPRPEDDAGLPAGAPPAATRDALLAALDGQKQVDLAARIASGHIARGHAPAALVAALGRALLREDAEFHTIQALEAAVSQHDAAVAAGDAEGARVTLIAAARYLAAHSPTPRERLQTATTALRLHRGERIYE